MRRNRIICVATRRGAVLAVLVLLAASMLCPVEAGAWTMPRRQGQTITTLSFYRAQGGFDDQGQPVPSARFQRIEGASYLEYGLSSQLTVGTELRYDAVRSGSGSSVAATKAPGDVDLFVRQHVGHWGPWIASVQVLAKLPLYARAKSPAPGNGRREYELRAAIGRNIRLIWPNGFVDTEVAYRRGTEGLADQFRTDATIGLRPTRWLLVLMKTYRTQSLGLGDGAPGSSYSQEKLEASGVVRLSRWLSLELGAGKDLSGERVGLGSSAFAAFWVHF